MQSSTIRRVGALVAACVVSSLAIGSATAAAPIVETSSVHIERPFVDCPDFATIGVWDIDHRLVLFLDDTGTPFRDIERVDYSGRIVNAETGAWVADRGTRIFFDTLDADGNFLTTIANEVRKSQYIHGAGRTNFQTGDFHGTETFSADNIAALCEALGG